MTSDSSIKRKYAYLSMEIGLDPRMHTYSGGLGVLAGDTVKSFAKLEVPAVAVTQLNRRGYCKQELEENGNQVDYPNDWNPGEFLEPIDTDVEVIIEGNDIKLRAWKKEVKSPFNQFYIPIFFLDTNLPENNDRYRDITDRLYLGDRRYRFFQEVVLGIGGFRLLRDLGFDNIEKYHLNESHSSLLALELLKENDWNLDKIKNLCTFTTHTPEKSGHDVFPYNLVSDVLGDYVHISELKNLLDEESLDMTSLALAASGYANAVSKRHSEVSNRMFPNHNIGSITNGVHVPGWVSEEFEIVYDRNLPGWRKSPSVLRRAVSIPKKEIWEAHQAEKHKLVDYVNSNTDQVLENDTFTIGCARRATSYKRADLIFYELNELKKIAKNAGQFQIIFGGKAHPHDFDGKEIIKRIFENVRKLVDDIKVVYLEDYEMDLAKLMTAGVDLWLNTPERGREACGTSGMKAACNGVPQMSTLDGWWIEGHIENTTGWSVGPEPSDEVENSNEKVAFDIYEKLEDLIIPRYYSERDDWIEIMLNTISLNASYFHTDRMVEEYLEKSYS